MAASHALLDRHRYFLPQLHRNYKVIDKWLLHESFKISKYKN